MASKFQNGDYKHEIIVFFITVLILDTEIKMYLQNNFQNIILVEQKNACFYNKKCNLQKNL